MLLCHFNDVVRPVWLMLIKEAETNLHKYKVTWCHYVRWGQGCSVPLPELLESLKFGQKSGEFRAGF